MYKISFISILGEPNSGKSTLINKIVNQKISIITPRKNTTRNKIKAIYTDDNSQFIFFDTPGFTEKNNKLEEKMENYILNSLKEADINLFLIPFWKEFNNNYDKYLLESINKKKKNIILLTKIDKSTNKNEIIIKIDEINKKYNINDIIPLSSFDKKDIEYLLKILKKVSNEEENLYYEKNTFFDLNEDFFIKEKIREKIYFKFHHEIPHNVYVVLTRKLIKENQDMFLDADVIVPNLSNKKIVIGSNGNKINEIKKEVTRDLKKVLNINIKLNLNVKVRKKWKDNLEVISKI